MNQLTTIRNATKTLLISTGFLGGNVFDGRDTPFDDNKLPLCLIYVLGESAERDNAYGMYPFSFKTNIRTGFEIVVSESASISNDVKLDELSHELLSILFRDQSWPGLFETIEGFKTDKAFETKGARHSAACLIEINACYRTTFEPIEPTDTFDDMSITNAGDGGEALNTVIPNPGE